jgi:gliding motility-associated-like protein
MLKYIQKYKLVFSLLLLFVAGAARGQRIVDSIVYTIQYDDRFIFNCGKATPIDLFKVANMYVSPENGYWGDSIGVPFDGKPGRSGMKEREYTVGNIFNTPISIVNTTVWYKFYFYFTSPNNYCGVKQGTPFILNLRIKATGCLEDRSSPLDSIHYFCYGSNVDVNPLNTKRLYSPATVANLLFRYLPDYNEWTKTRMWGYDWVDMDVYSDSARENRIGNGDMPVNLTPAIPSGQEADTTTFYVIIHRDEADGRHEYTKRVDIIVYRQSEIKIYYSPDNLKDPTKEFGMDDQITIGVDTSEYKFDYYRFFMNSKDLNKYFLGEDSTRNEITLGALTFSGVEDFIEIVATDKNNCIVRAEDNVIVQVPFPSVFTPDGDGINDVFLGSEKFRNREFHLEVSNRWGNLLYSGESGWDGTYRGNKVAPGTYLYILKLKTADGSPKTVSGTVTLIRKGL